MNEQSALVRSAHIMSCELGDETVLLDPRACIYYALNPVASRVWRLLAEPRAMPEVQAVLVAEFRAEPGRCHADLVAFVGSLVEKGLAHARQPV